MGKQQVISRFFAPKADNKSNKSPVKVASPSSSPSSVCIAATLPWPSSSRKRTLEDCKENPSESGKNGANPNGLNPKFSVHKRRAIVKTNDEEMQNNDEEMKGNSEGMRKKNDDPNKAIGFPVFDPSLHKKFVDKVLARIDEDGTLQESTYGNPPSGKEKYTPLEQQVVELKAKYSDILLMIEVGYKYRFFGDDAETAARVLGIFAHYDHNFLTASIPTFRLHVHVRRLVEAGCKVGVVRQTETAAIKAHGTNKTGPFGRSLSALYTRATLEAAEALGGGEVEEKCRLSSYLMCIVEQPFEGKSRKISKVKSAHEENYAGRANYDTVIGVIAVETSTGDVMHGQFKDTVTRMELESCLMNVAPAELLLGAPLSSPTEKMLLEFAGPASNVRIEHTSRDCFKDGGSLAEVLSFYENKTGETSKPKFDNQDNENIPNEERVAQGIEAVLAMPDLVVQALALALRYLKQFGLERILCLGASFRPFTSKNEMTLSSNTLQQLEILRNNADGSENGSLLWLMDHTHTAFGARLLKHWVSHPLRDRNLISARLDAVSEIAESMGSAGVVQNEGSFPGSGKGGGSVGATSRGRIEEAGSQCLLSSVLVCLGKMPDVERGITRIFHRTATAAEFIAVIHALIAAAKQLERFRCLDGYEIMSDDSPQGHHKSVRSQLLRRLISAASSSVVCEHAMRLLSALNKDAAVQGNKQNLFICAGGRFPEVAKCRAAIQAAEQKLDSFLPDYQKQLKVPNLQYMTVSGSTHLIEVPTTVRVPSNWMKVSSTKKTNRYQPPEVLAALDKLALAKEELTVACGKAWDDFLAEFAIHYTDFRAAVQALAALDCLHSLAVLSRNQNYVQPLFVEENAPPQISIQSGRHPVLESMLQESFVPNDTFLHGNGEHCQIITGPNMGGKSCYIRQVALIAIMAQIGSFVPAQSAKLHVLDAVYTRMGASDSIQHGSSTFFEELSEASSILQKATPQSLVIIDELGRGTSTYDGVAIAYATLHYLLQQSKCLSLFVSHYPKIVELKSEFPGEVNPYYVSYLADDELSAERTMGKELTDSSSSRKAIVGEFDVDQSKVNEVSQKITFLYKLVPGVATRSFGLHVARLAQLPDSCIVQAAVMAAKLEREVCARVLARSGAKSPIHGATSEEQPEINRLLNEGNVNEASVDFGRKTFLLDQDIAGMETQHTMPDVYQLSKVLCSVQSALKEDSPADCLCALRRAHRHAVQFLISGI